MMLCDSYDTLSTFEHTCMRLRIYIRYKIVAQDSFVHAADTFPAGAGWQSMMSHFAATIRELHELREGVQWWSVGVSAQRSDSLHELRRWSQFPRYGHNVAVALNMRVPLL